MAPKARRSGRAPRGESDRLSACTLATVLSIVPFTAPLIMFMRITVQTPPLWQIALSLTLLLLTIWGVAWFAGRVYRVGILMYGKKPTLPEIFRWARQAD